MGDSQVYINKSTTHNSLRIYRYEHYERRIDAAKGLTGVAYALKTEELRAPVFTSMEDLREYAYERFGDHEKAKFRKPLLMYKAARVICPRTISLYADAHAVELKGLLGFKFVTPERLLELKAELVVYFPLVKNLSDLSISTRDFGLAHKQQLPKWFGLVRTLWLIQPSSANDGARVLGNEQHLRRAADHGAGMICWSCPSCCAPTVELFRRGARKDAADRGSSGGSAAGGGASASSALGE